MSVNLVESVRSMFGHDVINKTASSLGESDSGIQKALTGIIPLIFGGLLSRSHSGGAGTLLDMVRSAATGGSTGVLSGAGDSSLVSRGLEMLRNVFGGHTADASRSVANYSGVSESSATSLMAMAAPVALGRLGQHAEENRMNAGSFSSFLESQKSHILNALPPGLNLSAIPGLGALGSFGGSTATATSDTRPHTDVDRTRVVADGRPAGNKWLLPAVLILAALALWYFIGRGCNERSETSGYRDTGVTTTTAPVAADTAMTTTTTTATTRSSTKVRLSNGRELDAYAGGVEEQLVNCLNDASCQAGKDRWFDFDNINFEVGSARLTPGSQVQIRNIASILDAYPQARIKVGGYTDKTGNDASNKKLSQERADAVMNAIRSAGAKAAQVTSAEGYGSDFAKVPATASDEERRRDRRIAVQLHEK
ncbi:MAG: DUF937 domain-containing protein [Chitinophagaceae bacterium]|nr:MAG: DUF937 domain-containing protein [Chitinophagaceae bacterium]